MNVLQPWVTELTLMQQSVLLAAVRGPDGVAKGHPCKDVIRWYRRCILISAFDQKILRSPFEAGGGSFTGPSVHGADQICCEAGELDWKEAMKGAADAFLVARDELPFHYWTHFMHAAEILGYKHPDPSIRVWWWELYQRMVAALHLFPESEADMDARLGDNEADWAARADEAGSCST